MKKRLEARRRFYAKVHQSSDADEEDHAHAFRMYPDKKPYLIAASLGCIPPVLMLCTSMLAIFTRYDPANIREDMPYGGAIVNSMSSLISGEMVRISLSCVAAPICIILAWKIFGPLMKDLLEWYYYDD